MSHAAAGTSLLTQELESAVVGALQVAALLMSWHSLSLVQGEVQTPQVQLKSPGQELVHARKKWDSPLPTLGPSNFPQAAMHVAHSTR